MRTGRRRQRRVCAIFWKNGVRGKRDSKSGQRGMARCTCGNGFNAISLARVYSPCICTLCTCLQTKEIERERERKREQHAQQLVYFFTHLGIRGALARTRRLRGCLPRLFMCVCVCDRNANEKQRNQSLRMAISIYISCGMTRTLEPGAQQDIVCVKGETGSQSRGRGRFVIPSSHRQKLSLLCAYLYSTPQ